ncbi:MAG: hypothetical protein AAF197_07045, partial [Pseudomonadota bacterium]
MMKILFLLILAVLVIALLSILLGQAPTKWRTTPAKSTPAERFENLSGYSFTENYADALGYQVHYIDEGPKDGPVAYLLHGQ